MKNLLLAGLLIVGVPAFYIIRRFHKEKLKKKRQLELGLAYDRLVKQEKLSMEHSELLNGKVIALDRRNKKVLLIDHNYEEKLEECVLLLHLERCRIIEVKERPDGCIKKIFLEMKYKQNGKTINFNFYDDSYDRIIDLPSLARRAKFWKNRIDLHKYHGHVCLELEYVL